MDEAVSRYNKEFKYAKGAKVIAEELDPARFGDVSGIYFVLSFPVQTQRRFLIEKRLKKMKKTNKSRKGE